MNTTTRRRIPARFHARVVENTGAAPTPAPLARGERWHEAFLPGVDSPAQRRQAEITELEALRLERSTLLGRIDVLEGTIATMKRERVAEFERGVRTGNRQRGLPSILGGGAS